MLVSLNRREHLAFNLTKVSAESLTDTALAVRLDLCACRWLEILAKLCNLLPCQRQAHNSIRDLGHLLRRDVTGFAKRTCRDRETVEDVLRIVADNLINTADVVPVRGQHLPASLD